MYSDAYDNYVAQANDILLGIRQTANEYRIIFGKEASNNLMLYYKMGSFSGMIRGLGNVPLYLLSAKEEDEINLLTEKINNEWKFLFINYINRGTNV